MAGPPTRGRPPRRRRAGREAARPTPRADSTRDDRRGGPRHLGARGPRGGDLASAGTAHLGTALVRAGALPRPRAGGGARDMAAVARRRLPVRRGGQAPPTPDLVAPGGSSALPTAASAYGRAVEAGARFAADRSRARPRRGRARGHEPPASGARAPLDPRTREMLLPHLRSSLDETEREDAIRGRWFVERQDAADRRGRS